MKKVPGAVGSETVLVDDPLLTAREVSRLRPLIRAVFDRRLRVSPSARLFSTLGAGPVIIVTTPDSLMRHPARARELEQAGAQLEAINGVGLSAILRRLAELEITSLLVEGGPVLQRAFIAEGLADGVHLYVAPMSFGGGVRWLEADELRVAALADRAVMPCGPDVFMEGYVHGID